MERQKDDRDNEGDTEIETVTQRASKRESERAFGCYREETDR